MKLPEALRNNPDLIDPFLEAIRAFWFNLLGNPSDSDVVRLVDEISRAQVSALLAHDEDREARIGRQIDALLELERVRAVWGGRDGLRALILAFLKFTATLPFAG